MSRTNIELDDDLIRKARKLTRLKTKRQIVQQALESLVRAGTRKGILRYYGSGIWQGRLEGLAKEPCLTLVDTSVWIDFFSASPGEAGRELHRLISEAEPVALAGVIVTEVLQGLKRDAAPIERYLALWELLEPHGFETYRKAAALHRLCRSRGVTLTTVDALIATLALDNGAVLFSLDRDFSHLTRFTTLELYPALKG